MDVEELLELHRRLTQVIDVAQTALDHEEPGR
jgi:hypothetical protein